MKKEVFERELKKIASISKEFGAKLGWIRLGGIWKGVKIKNEDIKEVRQELLKKLEERGEKY